jgi:hypothetical protein
MKLGARLFYIVLWEIVGVVFCCMLAGSSLGGFNFLQRIPTFPFLTFFLLFEEYFSFHIHVLTPSSHSVYAPCSVIFLSFVYVKHTNAPM